MVKLKNPDDIIVVSAVGNSESQADLNLSTISNADSEKRYKIYLIYYIWCYISYLYIYHYFRASTAAHRSLPDIPVTENNGDNGSELYETVADKRLLNSHQRQDKSRKKILYCLRKNTKKGEECWWCVILTLFIIDFKY